MKGQCLIVPIQHHLNMLEADDDTWTEVKVSLVIDIIFHMLTGVCLELHEVSNAHVCRRRQGRRLLRDCYILEVAKAYVH